MRSLFNRMHGQDMLNRASYQSTADYPQARTFAQGIDFIEKNHQYDNWFIQIETFDPHEPFDTPDQYISKICDPDTIGELDWPPYAPVTETEEEIRSFRMHYLALLAFCDESLGKVLDAFDVYDLWKDTMLIVNTDHGYMLGEHGWWSKGSMPDYQETMHTPFFIWDPRSKVQGERRQALVQTIDIAPLGKTVAEDTSVREYALFGYHGGTLNVTDGRYKLMLAAKKDAPQGYDYTLMPTHMRARFSVQELQQAEWREPFSFTKGCHVIAVPTPNKYPAGDVLKPGCELLFDLQEDPGEMHPIENREVTARLKAALRELLKENDAPAELYDTYNW